MTKSIQVQAFLTPTVGIGTVSGNESHLDVSFTPLVMILGLKSKKEVFCSIVAGKLIFLLIVYQCYRTDPNEISLTCEFKLRYK